MAFAVYDVDRLGYIDHRRAAPLLDPEGAELANLRRAIADLRTNRNPYAQMGEPFPSSMFFVGHLHCSDTKTPGREEFVRWATKEQTVSSSLPAF